MKNKDKIELRRQKLRLLLLKETEEYQYQAYSNNCPESLLNKVIDFKNYNKKDNGNEEEKNNYLNVQNNDKRINNFQIQNMNGNYSVDTRNNYNLNNTLNRNNIQDFYPIQKEAKIENNNINNNKITQENNYLPSNQQNNNNMNTNLTQNENTFKYGNSDIDNEINGYNDYYNKLRVDEFMSKKKIQDDLLNQINQKLDKINKNINDKTYQEYLALQYFQNKKINNENNQ